MNAIAALCPKGPNSGDILFPPTSPGAKRALLGSVSFGGGGQYIGEGGTHSGPINLATAARAFALLFHFCTNVFAAPTTFFLRAGTLARGLIGFPFLRTVLPVFGKRKRQVFSLVWKREKATPPGNV